MHFLPSANANSPRSLLLEDCKRQLAVSHCMPLPLDIQLLSEIGCLELDTRYSSILKSCPTAMLMFASTRREHFPVAPLAQRQAHSLCRCCQHVRSLLTHCYRHEATLCVRHPRSQLAIYPLMPTGFSLGYTTRVESTLWVRNVKRRKTGGGPRSAQDADQSSNPFLPDPSAQDGVSH